MSFAPWVERFVARHAAEIRALLLLAATLSVLLQARNQTLGLGIETTELARSLASGRGFMLNGVPSAHAAPLFPLILAGLLKLFGDGPPFSFSVVALEIVLQWTIILLLPVVSKRLLKSAFIGYCAAAMLIPANVIWLGWESSAGAVGLEVAAIATATPLVSGSLMGLGALLSPVVGLAIFVMHFRWNRGFALGLIVAALVCSPWTIRNYRVFHRLIPIRDNLGLEFRLSYNPFAAPSLADNRTSFFTYDPIANRRLRPDLARMGESAFYEVLGRDAWDWIRSNPQTSLRLAARRFVAYWFPPDQRLQAILTIFSFWGAWLSRHNTRLMRPVFALWAIFPMPYYLIQSAPRYRAPTLWFTALLAGLLISKAAEFFERRAGGEAPLSGHQYRIGGGIFYFRPMRPRHLALGICGIVLGCALPAMGHDVITTKITWNREILRIIYSRCASCHRAGGSAFSLMKYDEGRPWAKAIQEEVLERRMPPWGAVKGFGDYRDDQALTPEQLELIAEWVDGGAPEGEEKDLPPLPKFDTAPASTHFPDAIAVSGDFKLKNELMLDGLLPQKVTENASLQITAELPDGSVVPLLWLFPFKPAYGHPFFLRNAVDLPGGTTIRGVPAESSVLLLPASQGGAKPATTDTAVLTK